MIEFDSLKYQEKSQSPQFMQCSSKFQRKNGLKEKKEV